MSFESFFLSTHRKSNQFDIYTGGLESTVADLRGDLWDVPRPNVEIKSQTLEVVDEEELKEDQDEKVQEKKEVNSNESMTVDPEISLTDEKDVPKTKMTSIEREIIGFEKSSHKSDILNLVDELDGIVDTKMLKSIISRPNVNIDELRDELNNIETSNKPEIVRDIIQHILKIIHLL